MHVIAPHHNTDPRVSVVMAVRNDAAGVASTLAALGAQTLPAHEFEILVVDDASSDETVAAVAAHPHVRLLRQDVPGGAYVARNRAIEATRAPLIAFTDADCRPRPSWLERGLSRLAHEGPDTVLAGHIAMPLSVDASLGEMVDVIHHLDQRRWVQEEGSAVTANLLVPREAFQRVGLFEVALRGGDREWTARAKAGGFRLVYAEEAVVEHDPRDARALLRKSLAVGRAAGGAPLPLHQRSYGRHDLLRPRYRRDGKRRIRENGGRPGRARWLAVGVAQLALVQIPQAVGALETDLRRWRASRRSS